jgi:hypothetical protein
MDMCASFWLFNSNPEAMCVKCLIQTLNELMSKMGIIEEYKLHSKPSLAYLLQNDSLTDFCLPSNAATTSQLNFTALLPSTATRTASAGVPMWPWWDLFPTPTSFPAPPQPTIAAFPPTSRPPTFPDRFLLPSTPLPLPTLPPGAEPFMVWTGPWPAPGFLYFFS